MTVVDMHAHVMVPAVDQRVEQTPLWRASYEAAAATQSSLTLSTNAGLMKNTWAKALTDLDDRLAAMDAMGVDVQAISVAPTQYWYGADRALSSDLVEMVNDGLRQFAALAPQRFTTLATVSLQFPDLAAEQLQSAVRAGMPGVMISSQAAGRDLSHPEYDPFWAAAERLRALVFIHPLGCSLGARLQDNYLGNIVGQPTETTVALSHLIFGGVLDRFPALRICAAHGGGYLPYYIGRSDHGYEVRADVARLQSRPSDYLQRLFYDTVVHRSDVLRHLVDLVGPGQVLLGTDHPYDMAVNRPLELIDSLDLEPADRARIVGGNALDLFATCLTTNEGA